jgi:hypothetical protein
MDYLPHRDGHNFGAKIAWSIRMGIDPMV